MDPIKRYLEDAIAAEKSFESQLKTFASEASYPKARALFEQHAQETNRQYKALTSRLESLGGSTSTLKGFLAGVFGVAPRTAQLGHSDPERTVQDVMMAFAVENAEVAMYEALRVTAVTADDPETARLATRIQAEEQATAERLWAILEPAAADAFESSAQGEGDAKATLMRYLEDTEAAERNFEDALASFSKAGDQSDVQSLMGFMSEKARTQHERLRMRLEELGGSRSVAKSALAHLLAFSPLTAQMGHEDAEKSTQHLMITYAAAAAEMAMYESLCAVARAAGDNQTYELAKQLQSEEKEDHRLAWEKLPHSARAAAEVVLRAA